MFGPAGPLLSAEGLHPWVWNAAVDLWDGGHHRQAVQEAYTKAKAELGVHLTGKDLWAQAFSTHPPTSSMPRFRFATDPADDQRWTSAHEGAQRFGMGCAQGLRNWAAHELDNADEQVALEYLAALSILARWVSAADVERAAGEP